LFISKNWYLFVHICESLFDFISKNKVVNIHFNNIQFCYILPYSITELAQELKTGKLISKFEDFDYSTDGEDESPYVYTCSFVLAIMYFERLKVSNPNYLKSINSSEFFLISLVNQTIII